MNCLIPGTPIVIVAQPTREDRPEERKPAAAGLSGDLARGSRVGRFWRAGRGRGVGRLGGQTASAVSGRSTASCSERSTTAVSSPKSRTAVATVLRMRVFTRSERTFFAMPMALEA